MPKTKSFFTRSSYKKEEYASRVVVVSRNDDNSLGFSLRGGIETDTFVTIDLPAHGPKPNCVKGKLKHGDLLLSVNDASILGEPHAEVVPLLKGNEREVKLTVCTPKSPEAGSISALVKRSELDPGAAKMQDEIKKKLFDMAAPFTTRPMAEGELQGREYNFVTTAEFEQLIQADRLIEYSRNADGSYYGTVKPTPAMASKENRRVRRATFQTGDARSGVQIVSPASVRNRNSQAAPNQSSPLAGGASGNANGKRDQNGKAMVQKVLLARGEDGRLGFAFDGGIEHGILLTIRHAEGLHVLGTTNREVKPGDCLLAINGTSVAGWTVQEAEEFINGLDDPVEVTTTCLPKPRQLSTHDFLQVTKEDPADLAAAKEDVRRDVYTNTVPYTTRAPRNGEKDGTHYHFVSRDEFQRLVASDKFVEWGEKNGICYGTPKRDTSHSPRIRRATSSQRLTEKAEYQPSTLTLTRTSDKQELGMTLVQGIGRVLVEDVHDSSPASRAYVRRAMEIISINGEDMALQDVDAVKKALDKAGQEVELHVKYNPTALKAALAQKQAREDAGETSTMKKGPVILAVLVALAAAATAAFFILNQ